jgi:hypothetical protein
MRLTISIVITLIVGGSCSFSNTDFDQTKLLTSNIWKLESNRKVKNEELITFNSDGSFTITSDNDNYNSSGVWKWVEHNELFLQYKSLTISGITAELNRSNYYIRIQEISDERLVTRSRYETDDWDSGFAKTEVYIAAVKD